MARKIVAAAQFIEVEDHSQQDWSGLHLLRGSAPRNPQEQAARLADQFVRQNSALLHHLDVRIERDYDGREMKLRFIAGGKVGAVPLYSPLSARLDHGLVVKPRFAWRGVGAMLGDMGWRVVPQPLKLPLLPRSERKIPAWVLASMILTRLNAVMKELERRFESVEDIRLSPRGSVNWNAYATKSLVRGRVIEVPCRFPELRDDRELRAAIKFVADKQRQALEGQRVHGHFVLGLIEMANRIVKQLDGVNATRPQRSLLDTWLNRPFPNDRMRQALQGMEWTLEDRGLAGSSELSGLPWRMDMNGFFEAWVERVLEEAARQIGGRLRVGRKQQTVTGLNWKPGYSGSQNSLVPDFVLETANISFVIDAKYKRHWEELQFNSRGQMDLEVREHHRADLLQVLAYANLVPGKEVVVCLVYPCSLTTWQNLESTGRLWQQGELVAGGRRVQLWLSAIPMERSAVESASAWVQRLSQESASKT